MQLLDHVSISVQDIGSAKRFYTAILSTLGAVVAYERDDAIGFGERNRPNDDRHTYLSIYQSPQAYQTQDATGASVRSRKSKSMPFMLLGLLQVARMRARQAYEAITPSTMRHSFWIQRETRWRLSIIMQRPIFGMQGTPISVVSLCWHRAGAPDAGRWAATVVSMSP